MVFGELGELKRKLVWGISPGSCCRKRENSNRHEHACSRFSCRVHVDCFLSMTVQR
jgi:hypothetical protein